MANSLNNDLHLKHMALPQDDLPDDDDVELEDDSAETEPHRQPEAMPGWFKAALVLLALVLMSAAGAGYLYLTGDLSLGASDPSTPSQSWQAPAFTNNSAPDHDTPTSVNDTEPAPEAIEPATGSAPMGYTINDADEAGSGTAAPSTAMPAREPQAPAPARQARSADHNDRMDQLPMGVLADLREGLTNIEQVLVEHREELKRLNSLITNNDVKIQNQAEDLALLSQRVTQANQSVRSAPPPQNRTPTLNIALISMQQMGSAQAVGVRYRGRDQRLQLGQSIDGWRLSAVRIDQGTAQFTHTASNHTVTVAL